MGFAVQVVTPPAVEPVSLDELKQWLRIDTDDEDALITSLGIAARRLIERTYDCALVTQTLNFVIDRFPLPGTPYLYQQYSWGFWGSRLPMMNLVGAWWAERNAIFLPYPPLQSVSSITYTAMDGTTQTVDPANYKVDSARMPGRVVPVFGGFWPFTQPGLNTVTVKYVAGYGLAAAVPETIKTALKMMVGHWYENREIANIGNIVTEIPMGAKVLLMSEWDGEYY